MSLKPVKQSVAIYPSSFDSTPGARAIWPCAFLLPRALCARANLVAASGARNRSFRPSLIRDDCHSSAAHWAALRSEIINQRTFCVLPLTDSYVLPLECQSMRILIADDSSLVRERLVHMLSCLEGVEIVGQAVNAPQARALAAKFRPDLTILGLRMSRARGVDVLVDIKKLAPAAKVIVLTDYPFPENRKKCVARGADYFFDKSNEFQDAVSVLRNLLTAVTKH